ncbi:amino acid transporter [Clavulina sp. PMI_390]|nr:amino acid transporter [Clavulina sp. PMI_390]
MADTEKAFVVSSSADSNPVTRVSSVQRDDPNGTVQHQHHFSLLSAIGLAFAILNSWTAMAASLNLALPSGGPTAVIWGVVVSGIGDLCIVLSLAEICNVYPTSGGQYHWAYVLSPPSWAPLISWINGWFAVAGWWALTASGGSLAGDFITGIIALLHPGYTVQRWHIFLVYIAFVIGAALLNIFFVRLLPFIDRAALFWSLAGAIIISITVLACQGSGGEFQDAEFVFGRFINEVGWSDGVSWLIGLLQSAFGLTAYDAVAHLVDEMPDAAVNAPKAMIMSVVIGSTSSFVFLVVLLFCLTDVDAVISSSAGALLEIMYQATRSKAGAVSLLMFPVVCMAFATQSILTTASRMTYAFARDGGLPFSPFFARHHHGLGVPVNAILLTTVLVVIFGLIFIGSSSALNAILSSSVVGLNISYSTPIVLLLVRGRRILDEPVPIHGIKSGAAGGERRFNLGPVWGPIINAVGLAFAVITTVFFLFPPALPVTSSNMNYTIVVFGIVMIASAITWFTDGRKNFKGPKDFVHGAPIEK